MDSASSNHSWRHVWIGTRRDIHCDKNVELLGVIESKWNEERRQHVFKVMEEQDRI